MPSHAPHRTIRWFEEDAIRVFDATLPLAVIVRALQGDAAVWAVLRRPTLHRYYAFRVEELRQVHERLRDRAGLPAEYGLELSEGDASRAVRAGEARPLELRVPPLVAKACMKRLVGLDDRGEPAFIGEMPARVLPPPAAPRSLLARPAAIPVTASSPAVEAILSVQAPAQVEPGQVALVRIRLELAGQASPLAQACRTVLAPDRTVTAILSIDEGGLRAMDSVALRVMPPSAGQPTQSAFPVCSRAPESARLAVFFTQGETHLATLPLSIEVASRTAARLPAVIGSLAAQTD